MKVRLAIVLSMFLAFGSTLFAQDAPAARRERAQQFHLRAQERTGILVPLYVYPADIQTNAAYNRLIELKRRYETVPIWVIVNPASGPGTKVDPNYAIAIDRLRGAGCVVIGYVSTSYCKRPAQEIQADVDAWLKLYPRTQGIFFDEMIYDNKPESVKKQADLKVYAKSRGFWPTIANPGTDTPASYFAADAADVFVVHEGETWPAEKRLKGTPITGYADHSPFTRAVLVHSMSEFDPKQLAMVRKYARWVYITDDPYRLNDPKADNPWDTLSKHMEAICDELAR